MLLPCEVDSFTWLEILGEVIKISHDSKTLKNFVFPIILPSASGK